MVVGGWRGSCSAAGLEWVLREDLGHGCADCRLSVLLRLLRDTAYRHTFPHELLALRIDHVDVERAFDILVDACFVAAPTAIEPAPIAVVHRRRGRLADVSPLRQMP